MPFLALSDFATIEDAEEGHSRPPSASPCQVAALVGSRVGSSESQAACLKGSVGCRVVCSVPPSDPPNTPSATAGPALGPCEVQAKVLTDEDCKMPCRALSDFATIEEAGEGHSRPSRAWPTPADARMLRSRPDPCDDGSVLASTDMRATLKPTRFRLRAKTRPWLTLASLKGQGDAGARTAQAQDSEGESLPSPPKRRRSRASIAAAQTRTWECDVPDCCYVVSGNANKVAKARYDHNRTWHGGAGQVGRLSFEKGVLRPVPRSELPKGQTFGWQCPSCDAGFRVTNGIALMD